MLIGGGGYMDLDDQGCARQLSRNVLIRMRPLFQAAGVATALADAPSDLKTDEGLGGFRIAADHADDLGKVIADVRKRTGATVWIAGHSRGSISAANAAARLTGPSAPDGVILMSAMMAGDARARKAWAAQSVFYVDLDAIKSPVLVIGHAADNCVRSPADLMDKVAATTHSARRQIVTVTGGPVSPGRPPNLAACEVREPHDFIEQEAEVAAGIARFMRGGAY
jgi:pimeloyl-ACP methyl ester carboxylesterase